MASPIEIIKQATSAAQNFVGDFKVSAKSHRVVMILSAAAAASAQFVGDNQVLLGASPDQVVYASAAATFIATVARIFVPKD